MPKQIDLDEYYKKLFEDSNTVLNNEYDNKTDRVKNALDKAWETRNFEIKLYWQRALYFWGFNAAIIAIIMAIFKYNNNFIIETLSLLGFVFSIGWIMSNHGSKFWQKNWEKHIDYLEDKYYGKLYMTIHPEIQGDWVPSISNVNLLVSYFMGITWLAFYFYKIGFINLFKIQDHTLSISIFVILPILIVAAFFIFTVRQK